MNRETAKACTALGALAMRFAATDRATYWPDGETPESDTDHTVMLGLVACAVASKHAPHLDVGKVAQYALVHDLVEAYAGDTNTFGGLTDHASLEKQEREEAALERIAAEFSGTLPWVPEMIKEYESLATPEARYIKVLDKVMPKITRLLNQRHRTTKAEFDAFCANQMMKMRESYGHDQEAALTVYEHLMLEVSEMLERLERST